MTSRYNSRTSSSGSGTPVNSKMEVEAKETVTETVLPTMSPVSGGSLKTVTVTDDLVVTKSSYWGGGNFWADWLLWVILVIGIVAGVVCAVLAGVATSRAYWSGLHTASWAQNLWVLCIFLFVALILYSVATFMAAKSSWMMGDKFNTTLIYVTFGLQLVLTVIAYAVVFRSQLLYLGFFFTLSLILVTAWQFYLFSRSGNQGSVWILMIYAVWMFIEIFIAWDAWSHNQNA